MAFDSIDDFLDNDDATLGDLDGESEGLQSDHTTPSLTHDIGNLGEEEAHHALIQAAIKSYSQFEEGALNVAMAELLDEMSKGRLTLMHKKVNAERMIIIAAGNGYLMSYMNKVLETMQERNFLIGPFYKVFLSTNNEFNMFVKEKYVKIYSEICDELGVEKDSGLMEDGFYSDNSQFRKYGLNNPPHKNDNNSTI
jgi:hypothetical protein